MLCFVIKHYKVQMTVNDAKNRDISNFSYITSYVCSLCVGVCRGCWNRQTQSTRTITCCLCASSSLGPFQPNTTNSFSTTRSCYFTTTSRWRGRRCCCLNKINAYNKCKTLTLTAFVVLVLFCILHLEVLHSVARGRWIWITCYSFVGQLWSNCWRQ